MSPQVFKKCFYVCLRSFSFDIFESFQINYVCWISKKLANLLLIISVNNLISRYRYLKSYLLNYNDNVLWVCSERAISFPKYIWLIFNSLLYNLLKEALARPGVGQRDAVQSFADRNHPLWRWRKWPQGYNNNVVADLERERERDSWRK